MRLEAVLEQHGAELDSRVADRRSLKLAARSHSAATGELRVVIHNISRTGLLVEAPEETLAVGDSLFIDVPETGVAESKVVWESGRFFGCEFRTAISRAAVSGALLQGEPVAASDPVRDSSGEAGTRDAAELVPERNFSVALGLALSLWGVIFAGGYLIFS
jgi:hypothetical protein